MRDAAESVGMRRGLARRTRQSYGSWIARYGIFAKTAKILTSTSFLVHRLTGEYVIDHYTAANFSPIYDVGTQDWCFDLADDA